MGGEVAELWEGGVKIGSEQVEIERAKLINHAFCAATRCCWHQRRDRKVITGHKNKRKTGVARCNLGRFANRMQCALCCIRRAVSIQVTDSHSSISFHFCVSLVFQLHCEIQQQFTAWLFAGLAVSGAAYAPSQLFSLSSQNSSATKL